MNKTALAGFHRALHRWYEKNGRTHLPWRNTRDAYAIYISEVMLQQTQVATVLERFYHPFMKRFPTLASLAKADRQDVLSAWQGLGYYSRAVNLHKAAQASGGTLPQSPEALMTLPGIGRNTAHAIASFAHHLPFPVMEANVRRVLCRIFAMTVADEKKLWENAELLLDTKNPFDYNQSMMDIGSMICTKRNPKCSECPANSICEGQRAPELYPAPKVKKAVPVRRKNILLLRDAKGRIYATPRESRFLGGLYHFPEVEQETKELMLGTKHYDFSGARLLGGIRQQYSHFTLEADVYVMDVSSGPKVGWYSISELEKLPVSMAEPKILALLAGQPSARGKT